MYRRDIIGHLIFWFVILLIGTMTIYPYYRDLKLSFMNRAMFLPVWFIATYLNWYFLMPIYFKSEKYIRYTILLLPLLFLLTVLQRLLCEFIFLPTFFNNSQRNLSEIWDIIVHPGIFTQYFAFITLPVICSIGIFYLRKWYLESYRAKQVLAQQKEAELNYLKAQINPHFLFNVLNNLYGLSLEESKKVPGMILKLSDLLSYTLYESNVDKIALGKELDLIEGFISLEKERYENRVQVHFNVNESVKPDTLIAPLLLIPLVENAFKHGVKESTDAHPIQINILMEKGTFVFEIKNKLSEMEMMRDKNQGIGLQNLRRRLDLLYPNKHSFETKKENKLFISTLKLSLQ